MGGGSRCVESGTFGILRDFWTRVLGVEAEAVAHLGASGARYACVRFASGQQLIFEECADAPPADAYDVSEAHAYHICVYLDRWCSS